MSDPSYMVTVAKDLEDLIPTYLSNRRKEVGALAAALAEGNFEQLRQVGHRMRGVGDSYGFEKVTELGKLIEEGAKEANRALIEKSIAEYEDYLARLKVVYE
jgi:HPt (histidine-containing phosphotransfer) domain-containing protein